MFENDFREKASGCDTFRFSEDTEDCTKEEFRQFLHFLSGCRTEKCFNLDSAHSAVVMIRVSIFEFIYKLSDFYSAAKGLHCVQKAGVCFFSVGNAG